MYYKYFAQRTDGYRTYSRDNFELYSSMRSSTATWELNILSRLSNVFVSSINDRKLLPKLVFVVADADITNYWLDKNVKSNKDLEIAVNKSINWIMKQHGRSIETHKERMPEKAKKPQFPQIIWNEAPLHKNFCDNEYREIFNRAVNNTAFYHDNTWSLNLKKGWDEEDSSLVLPVDSRLTASGSKTYWEAIDKTVKYVDTILMKKVEKPKKSQSNEALKSTREMDDCHRTPHRSTHYDRYHWNKNEDHHRPKRRHSNNRKHRDRHSAHRRR